MKPANQKIWCPQCHKRHKVPLNADGKTLRCRGCQFAFATEDGLKIDPGSGAAALIAVVPPAKSAATKAKKTSRSKPSTAEPSKPGPANPQLDHDYDDILDVLDSPTQEPVRAYRKAKNEPDLPKDAAHSRTEVATVSTQTMAEKSREIASENIAVVRVPVTRGDVVAHRRTRTVCMLLAVAFAITLGVASWLGAGKVLGPSIAQWERKLLYSFGVPARFLPPAEAGEDDVRPFDQVKLLGDHVELADRDDSFRDEFIAGVNPAGEPDFANPNREPPRLPANDVVQGRANNGGIRGVQPAAELAPDTMAPDAFAARENAVPAGRGPAAVGRAGFNRGVRGENLNRNRNRVPAWQPPTVSEVDRQQIATRGVDPTQAAVLKLAGRIENRFAIAGNVLFSVDQRRNFVATDWKSQKVLATRKLDANVLAIVTAADDSAADDSAASESDSGPWLLLDNGRFENWKLNDKSLQRQVSISLGQFDKENAVSITVSKTQIAFNTNREIIIADYLPTAGKMVEQTEIRLPEYVNGNSQSLPEPVHAIQFSKDGRQLLAVVHDMIFRFDPDTGKQLSKSPLTRLANGTVLPRSSPPGACRISSDLNTIFVSQSGTIQMINAKNGKPFGTNWPSIPLPIRFLATSQDFVVGLSDSTDPIATVFNFDAKAVAAAEDFQPVATDDANLARLDGPAAKPIMLAEQNENGFAPFQVFESTPLDSAAKSIQFLPDGSLAVLTNDNRILLVDWKNGGSSIALDIAHNAPIDLFTVSPDMKRVVTVASQSCRVWKLIDAKTGSTELVTEFAGHVNPVSRIVFCEDGTHLISGDNRGNLFAWSASTGQMTGSVSSFKSGVIDVVTKGDRGFYAMDQRVLARGDVTSNRDRVTEFDRSIPATSRLSKNAKRFAFSSGNRLMIADRNSEKVISDFEVVDPFADMQFSHNHDSVLLLGNSTVDVWDWRRGNRLKRFYLSDSAALQSFDISADDRFVAVATKSQPSKIAIFQLSAESLDDAE